MSSRLPPEIVCQIFHGLKDDPTSQLCASALNHSWLTEGRRLLIAMLSTKLTLKGETDFMAFQAIITGATSTFPKVIETEHLLLENLTTMTKEGALAVRGLLLSIRASRTLTLSISEGGIPKPIIAVLPEWGKRSRQVLISGGTHDPNPIFSALSSLPFLELVHLEGFKFKMAGTRWGRVARFSFPPSVKTLSVAGDASPFQFLQKHVLPDGGFNNISTISVGARFLPEDEGVPEMLDCFRDSASVTTIKLRPARDPSCRGRDSVIFTCPQQPLLKIRKLQHLEIDFSSAPAEWALNCLSLCAIKLSRRAESISVDIRAPQSPALWDEQGPAMQLEQLLQELDHSNPRATAPPRSVLTVHDFPAPLPERFATAPMVCRYPVTFINAGG